MSLVTMESLVRKAWEEGEHDYFGLNGAMTQSMYENALRHIKVFTGIE